MAANAAIVRYSAFGRTSERQANSFGDISMIVGVPGEKYAVTFDLAQGVTVAESVDAVAVWEEAAFAATEPTRTGRVWSSLITIPEAGARCGVFSVTLADGRVIKRRVAAGSSEGVARGGYGAANVYYG